MTLSNIQSSMPVLINVHQPSAATMAWPEPEEQSTNTAVEESIPFTRPSITTGAHLPWNVQKRSSYSVPRAICSLQTVPPITLLNNRKEATKLVYSKDSENAAQFTPPESPFKQKSHTSLFDEEAVENNAELSGRPTDAAVTSLDKFDPIESGRLGSNQSSSGARPPQQLTNRSTNRAHDQQAAQVMPSSQSFQPSRQLQKTEPGYPALSVKIENNFQQWPTPGLDGPVLEESSLAQLPMEPLSVGRPGPALGGPYAAESLGPLNPRASSLYKSSVDSSALRLADAVPTADETDPLDGSSRSQSLVDKRKSDMIEPLSNLDTSDPPISPVADDFKESMVEQRAVRRRLTSRVSAMRTAEKKNLEQSKLEKTYKKLVNENTELMAKLKRQSKACSELKLSLETTREKLRVSEDDNCKLKSEMQFLRNNLTMLPQPQASSEDGNDLRDGSPTSGQMDWHPDFPFPTQMPTQAEIAADLELDRQLLTHTDNGQEYLKEWQMW